MIILDKLSDEKPYKIFKNFYNLALQANQDNIEAVCISTFSKKDNLVDSRYVNLKEIKNDKFIFYTNYNSPKAIDFKSHNQISALIFWSKINLQIRMKANIQKTSTDHNKNYFQHRDSKKNALSISSQQSHIIDSYEAIEENYKKVLNSENTQECPSYWGGFEFKPFYFEFWEGHDSRINKRNVYKEYHKRWQHFILQP